MAKWFEKFIFLLCFERLNGVEQVLENGKFCFFFIIIHQKKNKIMNFV